MFNREALFTGLGVLIGIILTSIVWLYLIRDYKEEKDLIEFTDWVRKCGFTPSAKKDGEDVKTWELEQSNFVLTISTGELYTLFKSNNK